MSDRWCPSWVTMRVNLQMVTWHEIIYAGIGIYRHWATCLRPTHTSESQRNMTIYIWLRKKPWQAPCCSSIWIPFCSTVSCCSWLGTVIRKADRCQRERYQYHQEQQAQQPSFFLSLEWQLTSVSVYLACCLSYNGRKDRDRLRVGIKSMI